MNSTDNSKAVIAKWKAENKERIQLYNYCYRNGIDWAKFKKDNPHLFKAKPSSKRTPHKEVDGVECKLCGSCKVFHPLDNFPNRKSSWDGKGTNCKNIIIK